MKKYNTVALAGLLTASMVVPRLLFALASLTLAAPANGDVLKKALEMLLLECNENVQLLKLSFTGADSKEVDIGFTRTTAAVKQFPAALPVLGEGSYTAQWVNMGADSHRVEDAVTFVVDADATPVSNISNTAPRSAPFRA